MRVVNDAEKQGAHQSHSFFVFHAIVYPVSFQQYGNIFRPSRSTFLGEEPQKEDMLESQSNKRIKKEIPSVREILRGSAVTLKFSSSEYNSNFFF